LSYKEDSGKTEIKKLNAQGVPNLKRDFCCICESLTAEILYLPFQLIIPILKLQDKNLIEHLFKERRLIISTALESINLMSNSIAGTGLQSKIDVQKEETN
jgi:hypothetical protein